MRDRPSDQEIEKVARERLDAGLPLNVTSLRAAVGGGGSDRLLRVIQRVRGDGAVEADAQPLRAGGAAESLPAEVAGLIARHRDAVVQLYDRVRADERAVSAALLRDVRRGADADLVAARAGLASAQEDAQELARDHDAAVARVAALEEQVACLAERVRRSDARLAATDAECSSLALRVAEGAAALDKGRQALHYHREQAAARTVELKRALLDSRARVDALTERAAEQVAVLTTLTQERQALVKELSRSRSESATLRTAHDTLAAHLVPAPQKSSPTAAAGRAAATKRGRSASRETAPPRRVVPD